jgi:hypothetical protein
MRILSSILRSLIAVAVGLIVFVVAAVALVVGTIAVLIFGRRARFQVYRGGGLGAQPYTDPFGPKPPMRDVTPIKPQELT